MRLKSLLGLLVMASLGGCTGVERSCAPITTTVFAVPSTVTIFLSDSIQTTVTAVRPQVSNTVGQLVESLPAVQSEPVNNQIGNPVAQTYASTIYNTIVVTVTVDEGTPTTQAGPLSFVVVGGTTAWLGETPTSGESLVFATSVAVVTIVPHPLSDTASAVDPTITRQTTLTSTITVTESVSSPTPNGYFTGQPTGGWNATSSSFVDTSILAPAPATSQSTSSLPSSILPSDVQNYTTLSFPTLTSGTGGFTTAVVEGQTWTWTSSSTNNAVTQDVLSLYNLSTLLTMTSTAFGTRTVSPQLSSTAIVELSTSTMMLGPSADTTSTFSSTFPSSTACGVSGNFTLNFDDIPPLSIRNQSIDDVAPLPLFNPYHKFVFSNGFVVVPPPRVPYLPSSKPLLLEFIPNFTVNKSSENTGPNSREFGWAGDIATADEGRLGCFSFDFLGASLGCDSRADDCVFTFSGYRYNRPTTTLAQYVTQTIVVPACPQLSNCALTTVDLSGFLQLDVMRTRLTVGGLPKLWWADDIRLGWSNNSCSAGTCRLNAKLPKGPWGLKA